MNRVIIGSDNGLWPVRRQAITWTNADILSIRPLGTNFSEIQIKIFFIHKNASENIVGEMATLLSRGRWVNTYFSWEFSWGSKDASSDARPNFVLLILCGTFGVNFRWQPDMRWLSIDYGVCGRWVGTANVVMSGSRAERAWQRYPSFESGWSSARYRQTSNIRGTKSQNLNDSRLVVGFDQYKSRMKM